ncbi:MAG: HDIG domain-containing protein [Deltaproteobacteria bacterium]|nr:HDIG domain-containing protein [Deltaproteobacteria bacterium]
MNRERAWETVVEHVEDVGLRRHMLAVEAAVKSYAAKLGGDPEVWGLAGLLHDYDWEIHPTLEGHPAEGIHLLRERGFSAPVLQAILAHNTAGTGVERSEPLDFALLACDEITGLIIAATLVRPHKDIRSIKVKSIKRNWKDRLFTAAVSREEVSEAVEDFSRVCFDGKLQLWEHVAHVLEAMQGVAAELDLDGRLAS